MLTEKVCQQITNTLQAMLVSRGYSLPAPITPDHPTQRVRRVRHVAKTTTTGQKNDDLLIMFNLECKLGVGELRECVKQIKELGAQKAIIVVYHNVTPHAIMTIRDLWLEDRIIVETFTVTELRFNITTHHKVPKHRKLSDEEAKTYLLKHDAATIKLLRSSDPVARYMCLVAGDIVEIMRQLPTGPMCVYRRVIDYDKTQN